MPFVILFIGVGAAGAVALWSRSRAPTSYQAPPNQPTAPVATPAQAQASPTATIATTPQQPAQSGDSLGGGAAGALVMAAGLAGGELAAASATSAEAKAIAVPVGVGIAAGVYLSGVGGIAAASGLAALGAAGAICVPIVALTIAITTIVDQVVGAVKRGDWIAAVKRIAPLRAAGQVRESQELYRQLCSKIEPDYQAWPFPDQDWWNPNDPQGLGRPWPGFPGMPDPLSVAEVKKNPGVVPDTVPTADGKTIAVRTLLDAVYKDAVDIRDWGMANGVPGTTVRDGQIVHVTEGDRNLDAWGEYRKRVDLANAWAVQVASAIPWIDSRSLMRDLPGYPTGASASEWKEASAALLLQKKQATDYLANKKLEQQAAANGVSVEQQAAANAADRADMPQGTTHTSVDTSTGRVVTTTTYSPTQRGSSKLAAEGIDPPATTRTAPPVTTPSTAAPAPAPKITTPSQPTPDEVEERRAEQERAPATAPAPPIAAPAPKITTPVPPPAPAPKVITPKVPAKNTRIIDL